MSQMILRTRPVNVARRNYRNFFILLKIIRDFILGFWLLRNEKKVVTVFGSARFPLDSKYCKDAELVSEGLAKKGYSILTGGGPSIMEAANKGAVAGGGGSLACNIFIPREKRANPYVKKGGVFNYFFSRKYMLIRYSEAFVILPGGLGTLDEFFEIITLMQTGKISPRPIVFVGKNYWKGLFDWIEAVLIPEGAFKKEELRYIRVVETPQQAIDFICV